MTKHPFQLYADQTEPRPAQAAVKCVTCREYPQGVFPRDWAEATFRETAELSLENSGSFFLEA